MASGFIQTIYSGFSTLFPGKSPGISKIFARAGPKMKLAAVKVNPPTAAPVRAWSARGIPSRGISNAAAAGGVAG